MGYTCYVIVCHYARREIQRFIFNNIVIVHRKYEKADSIPLCRSKIYNLSYSAINKGIKFIYIM